jgi:two-component system, chemotaxis family, protein-glutamate methylesterase/glutaminase
MNKQGRDIIVMGTSAGGLDALDKIIGHLPTDLPASIFIVQHLALENDGSALVKRLSKQKAFECNFARDGQSFKRGCIYIAPPDKHLLIDKGKLIVSKGARENRYRPAIDPLFRSAAVAYGPKVIGMILTGLLDDGTSGLIAIKRCGGVTIVQDPKEAEYPDMPQSALNNLKVDYIVPLAKMSALLENLVRGPCGLSRAIPADIKSEALIAERVLSDVNAVNALGYQVPYNCPNCGGVLWEMKKGNEHRYRCHTGHSFTATALLTSQSERIEETLWISLRMFEERRNLLNNMAHREQRPRSRASYQDRAKETEIHIERIRAMLISKENVLRHQNNR